MIEGKKIMDTLVGRVEKMMSQFQGLSISMAIVGSAIRAAEAEVARKEAEMEERHAKEKEEWEREWERKLECFLEESVVTLHKKHETEKQAAVAAARAEWEKETRMEVGVAVAAALEASDEEYRRETNRMRVDLGLYRDKVNGDYWVWQGDGSDNLETLVCPVLIRADDLLKLVNAPAAALAAEKERVLEVVRRLGEGGHLKTGIALIRDWLYPPKVTLPDGYYWMQSKALLADGGEWLTPAWMTEQVALFGWEYVKADPPPNPYAKAVEPVKGEFPPGFAELPKRKPDEEPVKPEVKMAKWIENGIWKTAPEVDPKLFGVHLYTDYQGTGDCDYGCGCHMGRSYSTGKIDPFGACPKNPL